MTVLIAGGGIGGLALALRLHAEGIAARVFEQAASVRELGVGINILPHAIARLADLGLLPALDTAGIRTHELIYMTGRGQEILRQPRGMDAGYAVPQFSIHRGKLQALLHRAVLERLGPDAVTTDRRLIGFEQDDAGVTAAFADAGGATLFVRGDVLVGADGIHSVVRRRLFPDEGPPRWNGVALWRGATWGPTFLTGRSMIIAGGMAAKFVLYPIFADPGRPGEALTNWAVAAKIGADGDPAPHKDDWSRRGTHAEVLAHVEGRLTTPVLDPAALIRATSDVWVYPMCDRDPLPRWSCGRVTLLGDAAHPMYPVGSNGASQAILDAEALAKALAAHGPAGLAAYEAERLPATAEIVRLNRSGGPERVIDLVEARAPQGFDDLDAVATRAELEAIVGAYQRTAGFATEQVNRR